MNAELFIKRPVLAAVCSLLIALGGLAAIPSLPVAQYPNLAPPEVSVSAAYLGASAQTVETSVTLPLEQAINGSEGMRYMTSQSGNDGTTSISVVFEPDRDIDIAAVDVQNRVSGVLGRLPREVVSTGITVGKNTSAFLMAVGFYAENADLSEQFISNYLDVYVKDALKRVRGVSQVILFGERRYAMRVWLDPLRLAARKLTAADVVAALREQNLQVAAGQVGQQPMPPTQSFQFSVRAVGRLSEPREFERVILRESPDGTTVLLKDVGRVELGAEDYSSRIRFNGRDGQGLGVLLLPNANMLDVDAALRAELSRLSERFPPGLKYRIAFDPSDAVSASIREVLEALLIAVGLVIAVIFLFLQDGKSTLIPAATIPVSLLGTFLFIKALGFSINTLTLFGITLATGLVVDDAIVVIENIERHVREKNQSARAAAAEAMREVAGAVLATSVVLIAVFMPVAFFPGTTGRLYKQFALTIASSIGLSAFAALTLAPALGARLIGSGHHGGLASARWAVAVRGVLDRLTSGYARTLRGTVRRPKLMTALFVLLLGLTGLLYQITPQAFIPEEDQGFFMILVQAPEGASVAHTTEVVKQVEAAVRAESDAGDTFSVVGWSFVGAASSRAILFVNLKPMDQRKGKQHSAEAIVGRLFGSLSGISGAMVFPILPPAVQGLGQFGGFSLEVLDPGDNPPARLQEATESLITAANKRPEAAGLFSAFTASNPQLLVQIDRDKAKRVGVPMTEIADTLRIYMGSEYVNDFERGGRSYRVYAQADAPFRRRPQDLLRFYVRSDKGAMVPLGALLQVSEIVAPLTISHFNLFRSASVSGQAGPGFSTGQAIAAIEQTAKSALPPGMVVAWSGLTYEQLRAGKQSLVLFGLGLLFVFLVLAAQYESFGLPLLILLSVPVALLGALVLVLVRGLSNDVFCQIGLVMLVGLSSKNAILIIEFAEQLQERGRDLYSAAVEAAEVRLRPILMTSLAFILGLLPLALATGAGSKSRQSLGTPVLGGMIISTFLNLYFIPVLYVGARRLWPRRAAGRSQPPSSPSAPSSPSPSGPGAADAASQAEGHHA
ncbi:MAG: efflux RND transporter permease subunit [Polyangia bacterium]